MIPTFPLLRRIGWFPIQKELFDIDQEVKKNWTLFGTPLNSRAEGYNEGKAIAAMTKMGKLLHEYRTR
jgi:hypothetical protein